MDTGMTDFVLNGIKCNWIANGNPEVVFLVGTGIRAEKPERIFELVTGNRNFGILSFQAEEWDRDFSPWKFEMPDGDEIREFGGEGSAYRTWIRESAVPWILAASRRKTASETVAELETKSVAALEPETVAESGPEEKPEANPKLVIAGYSLAGLFALWTFYEDGDLFDGVIAASASLWFDGWADYRKKAHAAKESFVYLSLGGKEPKSRNPYMCTIGEAYEAQKKCCQADTKVKQVLFRWNPGGHFADSDARLAKGIQWMLERI